MCPLGSLLISSLTACLKLLSHKELGKNTFWIFHWVITSLSQFPALPTFRGQSLFSPTGPDSISPLRVSTMLILWDIGLSFIPLVFPDPNWCFMFRASIYFLCRAIFVTTVSLLSTSIFLLSRREVGCARKTQMGPIFTNCSLLGCGPSFSADSICPYKVCVFPVLSSLIPDFWAFFSYWSQIRTGSLIG